MGFFYSRARYGVFSAINPGMGFFSAINSDMGFFAVHKVPPGFSAQIVHSMASPARTVSKDPSNPSGPAVKDGERCARVLPLFLGSARMGQMKQDEIWAHGIVWDTVCTYRSCDGRSAIDKGSISCMPPPSPSEPKDCNAVLRENLLYELPRLLFLALPEESLVPRISDVFSGRYTLFPFLRVAHARTHTHIKKILQVRIDWKVYVRPFHPRALLCLYHRPLATRQRGQVSAQVSWCGKV